MPPTPKLPRFQKGGWLPASSLNAGFESLERASKLDVSGGLQYSSDATGSTLSAGGGRAFPAKLTEGSGTGPYAWIEQIPQVGGGWLDGYKSGTTKLNPAFNDWGDVSLPLPLIVDLTYTTAAEYRFTAGECS